MAAVAGGSCCGPFGALDQDAVAEDGPGAGQGNQVGSDSPGRPETATDAGEAVGGRTEPSAGLLRQLVPALDQVAVSGSGPSMVTSAASGPP